MSNLKFCVYGKNFPLVEDWVCVNKNPNAYWEVVLPLVNVPAAQDLLSGVSTPKAFSQGVKFSLTLGIKDVRKIKRLSHHNWKVVLKNKEEIFLHLCL